MEPRIKTLASEAYSKPCQTSKGLFAEKNYFRKKFNLDVWQLLDMVMKEVKNENDKKGNIGKSGYWE